MHPTPKPQPVAQSDALFQLGVFGCIVLIAVVSSGRNSDAAKSAPAKPITSVASLQNQPLTNSTAPPAPIASSSARPAGHIAFRTEIIDPRSKFGINSEFAASPRDVFPLPTFRRGDSSSNQYTSTAAASARGIGTSPSRYYDPTYRPPVGEHYVSGYTKKDGTTVSGYYRTNRDDSFWNNYSAKGNVNPHDGKVGTKLPPLSSTHSFSPGSTSSHAFGGRVSGGRGGR
jgi:hypothetical protein